MPSNLPWKDYPSGADVALFGAALRLDVVRNASTRRWEVITDHWKYGQLVLVSNAKTKEDAKRQAEEWLYVQSIDLLLLLRPKRKER